LLELYFLGDVRVLSGGVARDLPRSRKTRALLAYLAVTGRPHRRERLCTLFWDVPDDPRGALRWSLSKLRALVDEPDRARIHADRATVALEIDGAAIDVLALRRAASGLDAMTADQLADAAAAFRGEFLEGLDLDSCLEFQAWCLAERQELRMLRRRVLSRLIALRAAQPALALPHVRTLVDLDPFDEAARATLVRVLAADGRHDEAEKQYELSRRALAELGAPPTGELDRARRDLRTARSVSPPGNDAAMVPAQTRGETAEVEPAGERKQVTILVASVGRTSPDAEDDPEAAMQELDPALEAMKEHVRRYDGLVSAAQPDGVMAVFGAPVAHEDHAVRACYAAIAMQAAVRNRIDGSPALRIGLHSGEAVVRAAKDGAAARFEAIGPVVSLAVRVGAEAEPGAILLTQETARRADGFVHVQRAETQPAWGDPHGTLMTLRGTTGARNRWEVQAARALTPFVGRESEMATLTAAMRRVESAQGEVVTLVADPGIGKSRLIHEFVRAVVPAGWGVLETGAAAHDTRASYRPVSALLRAWFGIEQRDQKATMESKVRARIENRHPELRPALPALMSLLDLPAAEADWPALSPPQRRRRTLDAVKALLACECRIRPVVLLFEDLHWIDAETQAVLDTLVDSLGALRVLLLATHRPEYRHGWSGKSYFSQLRLLPLASEAAQRLLESLLGGDGSLDGLKRELVARTEGTPLFVEETVRALAEAGAFSGCPGDYRPAHAVTAFEIPSTVQAVIAARIDRLVPASKSLLQVASVIGRDVPLALLQQVAKLPEEALQQALGDLRAAEFLHEAQLLPDIVYTFKHALTHEVAYGSVLRERRRSIHVEIVETIERLSRDRIDEQVEHLAHHAVKGRLWEHAVRYLFQAAGKAIQRSAHRQALEFIDQGLELIPKLPSGAERMRLELDYWKARGVTMMATKGWSAQEVSDAYVKAQALAEALADERELFVVLRGQGQFHMTRGEAEIARGFGDRCLALADKMGDPGMRIETHHLFWSNSLFMGDYAGTDHHAEHGIADYDRQRDHRLTYVYSGHDPGVCCRSFGGLALWQLGQADKALLRCEEALALAGEIKHPLTTGLAYWGLSYVHMFRGDAAMAQAAAEQEIAICEEYLLPLLLSQGRFQLGWAIAAQGALNDGIAMMQQGLQAIGATGAQMGRPYFSALFAEALAKAGRVKEGLAEIDRALAIVNRDRAYFQLPEIRRLKGALLLQLPGYDLEAVSACFRGAMATASEQRAPISEVRAAVSLARLLLHKGRRPEARKLLSDLCGRWNGMPESPELREARALLAG
jgi:DNA-binding SARP family transcriptional activator